MRVAAWRKACCNVFLLFVYGAQIPVAFRGSFRLRLRHIAQCPAVGGTRRGLASLRDMTYPYCSKTEVKVDDPLELSTLSRGC